MVFALRWWWWWWLWWWWWWLVVVVVGGGGGGGGGGGDDGSGDSDNACGRLRTQLTSSEVQMGIPPPQISRSTSAAEEPAWPATLESRETA